jgi:hypothetical protein
MLPVPSRNTCHEQTGVAIAAGCATGTASQYLRGVADQGAAVADRGRADALTALRPAEKVRTYQHPLRRLGCANRNSSRAGADRSLQSDGGQRRAGLGRHVRFRNGEPQGTVMKYATIAAILATLYTAGAAAQQAIIPDSRSSAWSETGVKGGIVNRTASCANLAAGASLASINAAIAACPAGQVVNLAAGTYTLAGGIIVNGKSNITIRGAGPDKTFLVFKGQDDCNGLGGNVCLKSQYLNDIDNPVNTASWTAGYAKGTTVVTLSSVANLQVGTLLMLDQVNDGNTDNQPLWMCRTANICCLDCATPSRSNGGLRSKAQATRVVAINGNQVTIDPAIIWPDFRSAQSPGAWWAAGPALTGVGIENLAINTESGGNRGGSIFMANVRDSWVKNVAVKHCMNKCIWMYQTVGITVRDSYFFDKFGADTAQEGSESYATDPYLSSVWRVENNIFHHITSPMICESGVGGVEAYNYAFDDFYNTQNPDWFQGSNYTHGACAYTLREGNVGVGFIQDIVHSPNYLHTAFRNRFAGWQPGQNLQTVAVHIYGPNRYSNFLGNVLGTSTYHTQYQSTPGAPGANCDASIYAIGWGGNCGGGGIANNSSTVNTVFRWGNWDTVSNAVRWAAEEVPTADANYPVPLPAAQTIPVSLYLAQRPLWWDKAGATPWPAIGPDVTGGDISNTGGHAWKIPAQRCYEAAAKSGAEILDSAYNAANCYGGYDAAAPAPAPPASLSVS